MLVTVLKHWFLFLQFTHFNKILLTRDKDILITLKFLPIQDILIRLILKVSYRFSE